MVRWFTVALTTISLMALGAPTLAALQEVHFVAVGPGGLKIVGKGAALEVAAEGESVVIKVPLAQVDTGIELRNSHMREKYLETQKYPHAELKVPAAALKEGAGQTTQGTFTVHGQSRPVAVTYDVTRQGDGLQVKGRFDINLKDYGIVVPSYLGVTVKPDVAVLAAFSVKP